MPRWVVSWARTLSTPSLDAAAGGPPDVPVFERRTLRQIARVSLGGDALCVRLSNAYGADPLAIGDARVALRASGPRTVPGSDRALTFGGRSSVTIAPGAAALSDPVRLDVPALADVAVSLFLPDASRGTTVHAVGADTQYLLSGDAAGSVDPDVVATTFAVYFLAGIEVHAAADAAAIVCLGDSLTAGAWSTADAHRAWPDLLAERLAGPRAGGRPFAVVNQGYSGNRLLRDGYAPGALARFDRDVLAQPGTTDVVVFEGINDLAAASSAREDASAAAIIAGYRQLIRRGRAAGLRVHGATLTPFAGADVHTRAAEGAREEVNAFVRGGGEFDAVFDFDAAVRDPGDPARLLPRLDAGDHIHLNDAGYEALADAVDLRAFR